MKLKQFSAKDENTQYTMHLIDRTKPIINAIPSLLATICS